MTATPEWSNNSRKMSSSPQIHVRVTPFGFTSLQFGPVALRGAGPLPKNADTFYLVAKIESGVGRLRTNTY